MIRVSVEVSSGEAARFRAEVRAPSIERAMHLATVSYPDCTIKVCFPIDTQAFFLGGAMVRGAGIPGATRGQDARELLELEWKAGRTESYRSIGRLVGRKSPTSNHP
jgi:hypothetical protein